MFKIKTVRSAVITTDVGVDTYPYTPHVAGLEEMLAAPLLTITDPDGGQHLYPTGQIRKVSVLDLQHRADAYVELWETADYSTLLIKDPEDSDSAYVVAAPEGNGFARTARQLIEGTRTLDSIAATRVALDGCRHVATYHYSARKVEMVTDGRGQLIGGAPAGSYAGLM